MTEILEKYPSVNYVLLKRDSKCEPFVAAWGYDEETGTWGQGHYFSSLMSAVGHIRKIMEQEETSDDACQGGKRMMLDLEDGRFYVDLITEGEYPGVDVEFVPYDAFEEGAPVSRPRVLFECTEEDGLRLLVWNDPDSEDCSEEIMFGKE